MLPAVRKATVLVATKKKTLIESYCNVVIDSSVREREKKATRTTTTKMIECFSFCFFISRAPENTMIVPKAASRNNNREKKQQQKRKKSRNLV
jgi:hypothetical protein